MTDDDKNKIYLPDANFKAGVLLMLCMGDAQTRKNKGRENNMVGPFLVLEKPLYIGNKYTSKVCHLLTQVTEEAVFIFHKPNELNKPEGFLYGWRWY